MGRYYDGDISGKFWFGVQSSTAADRFGVIGEPMEFDEDDEYEDDFYENLPITYSFDEDDLPKVNKEIEVIEKRIGANKEILDNFFKDRNSYNNELLIKYFKDNGLEYDSEQISDLLSEYADLELGYKIKESLDETGYCGFEAEI